MAVQRPSHALSASPRGGRSWSAQMCAGRILKSGSPAALAAAAAPWVFSSATARICAKRDAQQRRQETKLLGRKSNDGCRTYQRIHGGSAYGERRAAGRGESERAWAGKALSEFRLIPSMSVTSPPSPTLSLLSALWTSPSNSCMCTNSAGAFRR